MRHHMLGKTVGAVVLSSAILLSGCGTQKTNEPAGSFGDAIVKEAAGTELPAVDGNVKAPVQAEASAAISKGTQSELAKELVEKNEKMEQESAKKSSMSADAEAQGKAEKEQPVQIQIEGSKQAAAQADNGKAAEALPPKKEEAAKTGAKAAEPAAEAAPPPAETDSKSAGNHVKEVKKPKETPVPAATSESKYPSISWSGFFDNEDQTTPSDQFWDLSDASTTVQIKGFMGEVLSFDKNWFLLIPEPGAECPFDNGDETYWNKIMIVFVKDGTKLRYTSEPLQLTGRLDVGIKIDESGYKTMFRLYDAKFEEIKG